MLTAKVIIVNVGAISFEGLLGDNSQYYIASVQFARLFLAHHDHASRDVKALLAPRFQPTKATTNLNPNAADVISLDAMNPNKKPRLSLHRAGLFIHC